MSISINGMAHVILTVSQFEVAREFYRKLLPECGMKVVHDGDKLFYYVGARTAIGIEPCDPAFAGEHFVQQRVGLHHLCLRARSREDVDRCAALLKEMNATIVRGPMDGPWAPGYYYVLFEDPDGIRLEVNFVPGAGLLAEGARLNPEGHVRASAVASASGWYDAHAPDLVRRYEAVNPASLHSWLSGLLPDAPGTVLDIGAGSGRDAGWFAAQGYDVVAVEPSAGMRLEGQRLHHDPRIRWIDDELPDLSIIGPMAISFDVVMLTAVWQHVKRSCSSSLSG